MKNTIFRTSLGVLAFAGVLNVAAAAEHATPREARVMFDQAVKYIDENGPEKAFAAFNERKGAFVRKDLYVFVIDQQGVYRANGAAPDTLVGLNVLETRDAAGTPLFHNMLEAVEKTPDGKVRYVWLNRKANKVEPKVTYLHRSGDYVLGVGYFAPRATPDDARRMLDNAVRHIRSRGKGSAVAAFNNPHGAYTRNDLYVFVINIESGKFEAMGMNPKLTGTDAGELRDVEGKPLVQEMMVLAKTVGKGSVDYVWRNPVTNAVEKKRSFIRRVGDSVVGVGYYTE